MNWDYKSDVGQGSPRGQAAPAAKSTTHPRTRGQRIHLPHLVQAQQAPAVPGHAQLLELVRARLQKRGKVGQRHPEPEAQEVAQPYRE